MSDHTYQVEAFTAIVPFLINYDMRSLYQAGLGSDPLKHPSGIPLRLREFVHYV